MYYVLSLEQMSTLVLLYLILSSQSFAEEWSRVRALLDEYEEPDGPDDGSREYARPFFVYKNTQVRYGAV